MFPELKTTIESLDYKSVPVDRKQVLQPLIDYIQDKVTTNREVNLIFICTHNSRRSQFAQIWAKTAADYFGIPVNCFSGGVEITAFNDRAVESIKKSGFRVSSKGNSNTVYHVFYSDEKEPITAFSKLYDDPINKVEPFVAVMTCSEADENCPYIPGSEKRIALHYDDPKEYDGTKQERKMYDQRSMQIALEVFYVFSKINA